mmetsp:Transcript_111035/g.353827  ORF Transcript_111035/g.353827 Transcript_111035/m.353827 type:complete len:206 (+) Transcript_111035:430-1047(+)
MSRAALSSRLFSWMKASTWATETEPGNASMVRRLSRFALASRIRPITAELGFWQSVKVPRSMTCFWISGSSARIRRAEEASSLFSVMNCSTSAAVAPPAGDNVARGAGAEDEEEGVGGMPRQPQQPSGPARPQPPPQAPRPQPPPKAPYIGFAKAPYCPPQAAPNCAVSMALYCAICAIWAPRSTPRTPPTCCICIICVGCRACI